MEIKLYFGKYYTVRQIAEALQVSDKTVYNWCQEGTLDSCKMGGIVRITHKQFEDFMKKADRFALPSTERL